MSTASRKAQQAKADAGRQHPVTAAQEAANQAGKRTGAQVPSRPVGSAPGSGVRPAPAQAAPVAASATWNTWKGHGHPASFVYLGRNKAVQASPITVNAKQTDTITISLTDPAGLKVGTLGHATRFWAVVETTSSPAAREVTPSVKADDEGAKAARPQRQLNQCKCGCGSAVKNRYGQGHDARHVSQLASAYKAVVEGDSGPEDVAMAAQVARSEVVFSDKLTAKLNRSIELIDAKAAKKAQAQAAAKTDKAA